MAEENVQRTNLGDNSIPDSLEDRTPQAPAGKGAEFATSTADPHGMAKWRERAEKNAMAGGKLGGEDDSSNEYKGESKSTGMEGSGEDSAGDVEAEATEQARFGGKDESEAEDNRQRTALKEAKLHESYGATSEEEKQDARLAYRGGNEDRQTGAQALNDEGAGEKGKGGGENDAQAERDREAPMGERHYMDHRKVSISDRFKDRPANLNNGEGKLTDWHKKEVEFQEKHRGGQREKIYSKLEMKDPGDGHPEKGIYDDEKRRHEIFETTRKQDEEAKVVCGHQGARPGERCNRCGELLPRLIPVGDNR